jgi:hypothetical protein
MKSSEAAKTASVFRYLCPKDHTTYVMSDRGLERPTATAVTCQEKNVDGTPCNRFALYVERRT